MDTWEAEFPEGVNIIEQLYIREATCQITQVAKV